MKNKILCVAAHPDDEILGCGASMAKWAKEGHEVQVVIVAEGLTSRDSKRDKKAQSAGFKKLYDSAQKANDAIGVKKLHLLGLPDNRLDSMDLLDVVKEIEKIVMDFKPQTILTHFHGDLNIDHQIVHRAVLTAARPQPGFCVQEILAFEVPSSTDWNSSEGGTFAPSVFVNVEKSLPAKLKALEIYKSEMRDFPHARSIEALRALAQWRGASVGFHAAEAFQLVRSLRK